MVHPKKDLPEMRYRIPILLVLCVSFLTTVAFHHFATDSTQIIDYHLPKFDELTAVEVLRTGQPPTSLSRRGKTWTVNGLTAPMDPHALSKVSESLALPVSMDLEIGKPTSLSEYGLSEHAITISLKGKTTQRIRIGKVVNGRTTFIRDEGTGIVYRAQTNLRRAFDRPALAWRKRQIFDASFADVQTLRSERNRQVSWQVSRESAKAPWRFKLPVGIDAGQKEVDAVANTLVTASAQAFSDGHVLENPRVRLIFGTVKGQFGLDLGSRTQTGGVEAQALEWTGSTFSPKGPILILPRHQAIFLEPSASDLRNRRVFSFTPDQITGVNVERPKKLRLTRRGVEWELESGAQRQTLSREQGDLYADRLSTLRAISIASKAPNDAFDRPFGSITIKLDGARLVTATIGQLFGSGRYVRTDDEPSRSMIVAESGLRVLMPTPSEFEQGARQPSVK
jgi:hypothetical protein